MDKLKDHYGIECCVKTTRSIMNSFNISKRDSIPQEIVEEVVRHESQFHKTSGRQMMRTKLRSKYG